MVVATDDQVSTKVGDEIVILGMQDGMYYGLDAVGARVWPMIEAPARVADIVSALVADFDVDAETCERDLLILLRDLVGRGLAREVPGGELDRP